MTLGPTPEPVEVTWGPDGVEAIYAVDREWWNERLGNKAKIQAPGGKA